MCFECDVKLLSNFVLFPQSMWGTSVGGHVSTVPIIQCLLYVLCDGCYERCADIGGWYIAVSVAFGPTQTSFWLYDSGTVGLGGAHSAGVLSDDVSSTHVIHHMMC